MNKKAVILAQCSTNLEAFAASVGTVSLITKLGNLHERFAEHLKIFNEGMVKNQKHMESVKILMSMKEASASGKPSSSDDIESLLQAMETQLEIKETAAELHKNAGVIRSILEELTPQIPDKLTMTEMVNPILLSMCMAQLTVIETVTQKADIPQFTMQHSNRAH